MAVSPKTANSLRLPHLYWKELQQLKAACIFARLYRDLLAKRVRIIDLIKAIASSGGVAGWVIWKDYPFVWTVIIAAAQLFDAIKNVLPFAKNHKAASDLTVALEIIYIDAEADWENIYAGVVTDDVINKRRATLKKLQLDAERRHFPEGLEPNPQLFKLATEEARVYFETTFNDEAAT